MVVYPILRVLKSKNIDYLVSARKSLYLKLLQAWAFQQLDTSGDK